MYLEKTYGDLFTYNTQLNKAAQQYPVISLVCAPDFKRFQNRNQMALHRLSETLTELYEENVRMEDGVPQTIKEDDQIVSWDYKSSEHKKDFEEKWNELMQSKCRIYIPDNETKNG